MWRGKIEEELRDYVMISHPSPGTSSWLEEFRRVVTMVPRHCHSHLGQCHYGGVNNIVFSSDGQLLASCGEDARLHVWKIGKTTEENELLFEMDLHK